MHSKTLKSKKRFSAQPCRIYLLQKFLFNCEYLLGWGLEEMGFVVVLPALAVLAQIPSE